MKRKQLLLVGALTLAALLVSGIALAQDGGPQSPSDPAEALTTGASASLSTSFTYQGRLDKDGSPVNDTCDMRFRLYDAASVGTQVGITINAAVPVTDGLFSVNLDFGADAFTGDRRWLGVEVDCEEDSTYDDLGRQELTAAPYAFSLKPGAVISGTNTSGAILRVENSGGGSGDYAVHGKSTGGYGVYGSSETNIGVYGSSQSDYGVEGKSTDSYGLYGESKTSYGIYAAGAGGDLGLYGGSIHAARMSDSDMTLYSNDNVNVHLDDDDTSASQLHIRNGADTAVFTVDEAGSITSTADTQIVVSPLKGVANFGSDIELRPNGTYVEVHPGSAGLPSAYVPVDLPSVLYGTPLKLKSIRVCYKCDTSASFITLTRVRYADESGGFTNLISSSTNRDSTSWGCYTISAYDPQEIQGSLYVILGMDFDAGGESHDIQIGNITLTLTEQ